MIKELMCYKTHDGRIFESITDAKAHADDLLGEELDGLLKLAKLDITRSQEYKALLSWMKDRKELKGTLETVVSMLNFEEKINIEENDND